MTRSATEPMRSRFRPVRPWLPTMMRLAFLKSAALTMPSSGRPMGIMVSKAIPWAAAAASILRTAAVAVGMSRSEVATATPIRALPMAWARVEGFVPGGFAERRAVAGNQQALKT